jgi:hypothetical protein
MIKLVLPATLKMWDDEDDKMVVVQICQELVETIKMVGPAVVAERKLDVPPSAYDQ